jgi:hypothetical protein
MPVSLCECRHTISDQQALTCHRLDSNGDSVLNSGHEFILSVRGSVTGDYSLTKAEDRVHAAVTKTIEALLAGQL